MSIKLAVDNLTPHVNKVQRNLKNLSKSAYDFWKAETPIRTGNARSKTRLSNNTIEANYPYAKRLDDGYSRQSPRGMSQPTEKFIREEIKRILRK